MSTSTTSSSSSSSSSEHKHKGLGHPPRDGATGMGLGTQRHFVKVKQRMVNYVGQQEAWEYDASQQPATPSHKHRNFLDVILGDAQHAPKSVEKVKSPTTSRKHLDHLGLATPQSARRARKPSSTSDAK